MSSSDFSVVLVRDLRGERREVETYASLDFALNERFATRLGECNFSGRTVIAGMRAAGCGGL